jgi:lipopolysaccharide biosynthesis regulator YciM
MRTRGMTHQEIANELQVPRTAITSDIQYLRNQAKESIKEYAEYLPEQYHVYLSALDSILKHAYEILQTTDDNREKLQAMELFKDTHLVKLDLLSNADSALHYISNKQQEQQHQEEPAVTAASFLNIKGIFGSYSTKGKYKFEYVILYFG